MKKEAEDRREIDEAVDLRVHEVQRRADSIVDRVANDKQ